MQKSRREYESIRNEIVSINEMRNSLWVNMYIIYIALFSCGLQFSYNLFLVTYIILIPFQMKMNQYKRMFIEASIYIRSVYEKDNKTGWEAFHFKDEYINIHSKGKWYLMVGTGSTQLGALSTLLYIFFVVKDNGVYRMFRTDVIMIIVSILLLIILMVINWTTAKVIDINAYENLLEKYKMEK